MSSSLVVPSFVPVSLCSIAPCSSAVYNLPTTINSALASHPIVCPTAVPSLTGVPLQQPFMVGPGYSSVPFSNHGGKVRESGRFVSRKHYHACARAATLVKWPVSIVAHGEKTETSDCGHRVVDGSLFHFLSHSLLVFPAHIVNLAGFAGWSMTGSSGSTRLQKIHRLV